MKPELNLISLVTLIGAVHGIFLAFILYGLKQNRTANRLLSAFVMCFSLMMLENVSLESKFFLVLPHFSATLGLLLFCLPPLFYLYIKAMTSINFAFHWADAFHLVPFCLIIILNLPFYALPAEEKIAEMMTEHEGASSAYFNPLLDPTFYQTLIYFILSFRLIQNHSRVVKDNFSSDEHRHLKWLRYFFAVCGGIWVVSLFSTYFYLNIKFPIENLSFSIAVYALGYFSMRQPEVFATERAAKQTEPVIILRAQSDLLPKKYEKSTLTEETANAYKQILLDAMSEKKLFLNSELTLQDLSEHLGISTHHLSQVLNERLEQNFFDFVNSYRVEAVKEKLLSPKHKHLTVLAIAFESGFNSKTAFNAAFKKHTGVTPSEYRKSRLQTAAA